MYAMFKRARALILPVLLAVLLTACGSGREDTPLSLAVVAGVHSNAGRIPLSAAAVSDRLYDAAYTHGDVTMIRCDGNPAVFYQASIPAPQVEGLSEKKQKSIAQEYCAQLQDALSQATPQSEEVDTLQALRLAGQALRSAAGKKVLLVLDTGLSTCGYLDFTDGLLSASPQELAEALEEARALPELEGVTVCWAFCGQTAAPQPPLSARQQEALRDIWEAVLLAGGASQVIFTDDFAADQPYDGLPAVSLVDVEEAGLDVQPMETVVLDSAGVAFLGDSARFADETSAAKVLSQVAGQLLEYPDRRVCIVGTTASGRDAAFQQALSLDRARAVRDMLAGFGVDEGRMTTLGLGASDPWHVEDLDADGRQIETLAAQNRKVLILDLDGPDADLIRDLLLSAP